MHAVAYDIHQRRPATTIAGVSLFLSCTFLPSGDSGGCSPSSLCQLRPIGPPSSSLRVSFSRIFRFLSSLSLLVPLILFHLSPLLICLGTFISFYFLSNLSFKFSQTLLSYFLFSCWSVCSSSFLTFSHFNLFFIDIIYHHFLNYVCYSYIQYNLRQTALNNTNNIIIQRENMIPCSQFREKIRQIFRRT